MEENIIWIHLIFLFMTWSISLIYLFSTYLLSIYHMLEQREKWWSGHSIQGLFILEWGSMPAFSTGRYRVTQKTLPNLDSRREYFLEERTTDKCLNVWTKFCLANRNGRAVFKNRAWSDNIKTYVLKPMVSKRTNILFLF